MADMTVFKQRITEFNRRQELIVPRGAELLTVKNQNNVLYIWYRCDAAEPEVEIRRIYVCGTGRAAPAHDEARYLATAFLYDEVWHVFEEIR